MTVMEDEVEEEEVGVVVEEVEVEVDQEVVVEVDAVVLEEGVGEVMTGKILCSYHFCILFSSFCRFLRVVLLTTVCLAC